MVQIHNGKRETDDSFCFGLSVCFGECVSWYMLLVLEGVLPFVLKKGGKRWNDVGKLIVAFTADYIAGLIGKLHVS